MTALYSAGALAALKAQLKADDGAAMITFKRAGNSAIARRLLDKIANESISINDYGASPTATPTQNTAAINAAIADLPAAGGALTGEPGVYGYDGALIGKSAMAFFSNVTARDTNWTGLTLKATTAAACLDMRNCDHYLIRGIRLDGNGVAAYGIRQGYTAGTTHVAHAHLHDVTIQNCPGTLIDTGSGNPPGATNDCGYHNVILEVGGIGYDLYSTNNIIRGGAIAGMTVAGIRLGISSEVKSHDVVFSGNKVDYRPFANDFINGIKNFGTWHETSVDGIIKRYEVPSISNVIGSITFEGCNLATSNATALMDLTNCAARVIIIGGRRDPASPATIIAPAGNAVLSMGLLDEVTVTGGGTLAKMNASGFFNDLLNLFGQNIAAITLPGDATTKGAVTIGWNRTGGEGEANIIGAKGNGGLGGVALGDWDGATYKHLIWAQRSGNLFIKDCTAVPVANPVGGGYVYVDQGALKFRGKNGTVTTIGPA